MSFDFLLQLTGAKLNTGTAMRIAAYIEAKVLRVFTGIDRRGLLKKDLFIGPFPAIGHLCGGRVWYCLEVPKVNLCSREGFTIGNCIGQPRFPGRIAGGVSFSVVGSCRLTSMIF